MARYDRAIPDHKKHSAFPGLITPPNVTIQAGVIKPNRKTPEQPPAIKPKLLGSEWDKYEATLTEVRNSQKNASSAALQLRNGYEAKYALASRELMRKGVLTRIKKKYR